MQKSPLLYRTFRTQRYQGLNRSRDWKTAFVDLSFQRFEQDSIGLAMPPELAVLLVGIATRQAMSPTAIAEGERRRAPAIDPLLAGAGGPFCAVMADRLTAWKER